MRPFSGCFPKTANGRFPGSSWLHPDPVTVSGVGQLADQVKALDRELARLKSKMAAAQGDDLAAQAIEVGGKDGKPIRVLAAVLEGADVATLRETIDKLKDKAIQLTKHEALEDMRADHDDTPTVPRRQVQHRGRPATT